VTNKYIWTPITLLCGRICRCHTRIRVPFVHPLLLNRTSNLLFVPRSLALSMPKLSMRFYLIKWKNIIHATLSRMKTLHVSLPNLQVNLFKSLVFPVMSYGSQIWGPALFKQALTTSPTANTLDKVQLQFLHMISRVPGRTHHMSLLHEFGFIPTVYSHMCIAVRFWTKVVDMPDTRMLKQAMISDIDLMISRKCTVCWAYYFFQAMSLLDLCSHPSSIPDVDTCLSLQFDITTVKRKLVAKALSFITPEESPTVVPRCPRTCSSSRVTGFTYRYWIGMQEMSVAPHLNTFIPAHHRQLLVRLRLNGLPFQVVLGRQSGVDRSQRFCKVHPTLNSTHPNFSHNCVEDTRHFLLECPVYAAIRAHPRYLV